MSPGSQGLSPVKALSSSKNKHLPGISITGPSPIPSASGGVTSSEALGKETMQQPLSDKFICTTSIPPSPVVTLSVTSGCSSSSQSLAKIHEEEPTETKELIQPKKSSVLARIPEHRSFELEDLPALSSPLGLAKRVEIDEALPSSSNGNSSSNPQQQVTTRRGSRSKYDYPIVKHHPLFAKASKGHSGISSLLLGENIEFTRKQGRSLSYGVQSVRRSTPKLLTFEIYNPETDDLDSDTSHSSSPDSDESIISVIADSFKRKSSLGRTVEGLEAQDENKLQLEKDSSSSQSQQLAKLPEYSSESIGVSSNPDDSLHQPDMIEMQFEEKLPLLVPQLSLEDINRKSEERMKGLLSLLGENKTVLQSIHEAKQRRIGGINEQMQEIPALPSLPLPRSKSCSPNNMNRRSEASQLDHGNLVGAGSLDSLSSMQRTKSDASRDVNSMVPCVTVNTNNADSLSSASAQKMPTDEASKAREMADVHPISKACDLGLSILHYLFEIICHTEKYCKNAHIASVSVHRNQSIFKN
jgi:hypothetical protein